VIRGIAAAPSDIGARWGVVAQPLQKRQHVLMSKRLWVGIGVLAVVIVGLLSGVVAVAADDSNGPQAGPTPSSLSSSSSIPVPNEQIAKDIYGSGHAYVGDGKGGIAGWIDPTQLGANGDAKVYSDGGAHIGYWVDNLGFVDTETHDSPSYDPNALRVARFGPDAVQEWERLKSDLDSCLDTHTAPECAAQAGG
jgi:hypothetical protein